MNLIIISNQYQITQEKNLFRDITTLIKDENAFEECINQVIE
mgnify:CR=1 FL=1|tara:strand:- start:141 stop:266 length:126 start_codon:yes stop_codon:yes gene_type:complete